MNPVTDVPPLDFPHLNLSREQIIARIAHQHRRSKASKKGRKSQKHGKPGADYFSLRDVKNELRLRHE